MGWREGTGTGPRVTLQQRKQQLREIGLDAQSDESDAVDAAFYYAPIDTPPPSTDPHRRAPGSKHGIGLARQNLHDLSIDEDNLEETSQRAESWGRASSSARLNFVPEKSHSLTTAPVSVTSRKSDAFLIVSVPQTLCSAPAASTGMAPRSWQVLGRDETRCLKVTRRRISTLDRSS